MNTHKDHTATCYCCIHLRIYEGHPGYSEWTPGWEGEVFCDKDNFKKFSQYDMNKLIKTIMTKAQQCEDFVGREEE